MDILKYVLLGIVQGLTEFLPVSSSGHLVVFQKILGISSGLVELEIVLHLGTLLSILIFLFKDIFKALTDKKSIFLILIVTAITGAIGVLGKDFFEGLFSSVKAVSFSLVFTGIILLATRNFQAGSRKVLNVKDALILGITQAIAIVPGVSRSGMTISTLLLRKTEKLTAFTFSFLVSIPVIFGAAILKAKDIGFVFKGQTLNLLSGFAASFFSGLLAMFLLKKILHKAKFYYFGYYCIIAAIAIFLFIK
jgi:undecaprenyl-diphosphatase